MNISCKGERLSNHSVTNFGRSVDFVFALSIAMLRNWFEYLSKNPFSQIHEAQSMSQILGTQS